MKDIVIIANFCRDFSETDNGRFMYLCKMLSKENNVEIITSDFSHSAKKHKKPLVHNWPFVITFLHEPGYKKNISVQRFSSHYAWGKEVRKYLEQRNKPDVIYCAVPSLTGPFWAAKYCKKRNIKFIIDIQDLWPEAYKLVFNVPILSDIIFFPFKFLADSIYKKADSICAVSETYANRAVRVNRLNASKHVVFLGTNLDTFDNNAKINKVNKPLNEFWIGYCGTLGASYDITVIIDAISYLNENNNYNIKFIVLGDGERRNEFENHAKDCGVECVFTGRLSYDKMCGWISACDIAVNPIMHNAAQSIINKHGDYASAGIPVINTQECLEYKNLIEQYNMGFNCENGDFIDVAKKIETLINDKNLCEKMGNNSRKCAEEKFDRKHSYLELLNEIER